MNMRIETKYNKNDMVYAIELVEITGDCECTQHPDDQKYEGVWTCGECFGTKKNIIGDKYKIVSEEGCVVESIYIEVDCEDCGPVIDYKLRIFEKGINKTSHERVGEDDLFDTIEEAYEECERRNDY